MSELTLEGILEDLQRQGVKDSTGRFTLDASQALPKLKRFRLPDPHAYILKLLQAAVRGGASAFHLHSSTGQVQVSMEGVRFPLDRLPSIFLELLDETRCGDPALEHLAVGLHSSLGTRAQCITLAYWDGERGLHIRWRESGQTVEEWKSSGPPVCRVLLERAREDLFRELREKLHGRPVWSLLWGGSAAYDNEQRLLHGTGDMAPLTVTINRKPLRPSVFSFRPFESLWPSRHLFQREYCFPAGDSPGFRLAPWTQAAVSLGRGSLERFGAYAAALKRQGSHHFFFLRDGVVLRRMQLETREPAYVLVLDGDGLKTDFTTLQFVEDDQYREFFRKARVFGLNPGPLTIPRPGMGV
ncbi:hypothetical protein ABS71_04840 [bacterium SCN 62-11]|nr:hypothetical protein [Candidatus Eremiobacteraeota bacterium]ODT75081.1 MAG: hypothetical protein ABS71_04840 [bacterium SCN 62-11]